MRYFFTPLKTAPLCVLLAAALLCGGCASKYGEQRTKVDYYPECYAPIQELRASEEQFAPTVAVGAILGAVLGAAIGAMASSDNRARGALLGAGIGAAAGTMGGHAYARNRERQQEAERFNAYSRALDQDSARVDSAVLAAREANRCYNDRYDLALAQYKEGKIGKQGLEARVAEIRDGISEAEYILGEMSVEMDTKHREYVATLQEEANAMGRPVPEVGPDRAPNQGSAAAVTTAGAASPDPLTDLAYRTDDLNARRSELEAQREEMRRRLQQYDAAQQAVSGA